MTARVCARISASRTPMGSASAPKKRLSGRRELVPETKRKSPARLVWGNLPRGCERPSTTADDVAPVLTVLSVMGAIRRIYMDADIRELGIEVQRVEPPLTADTRQAAATERGSQVAQEPGI